MRSLTNQSSDAHIDRLSTRLGRLWENVGDRDQIEGLVAALDARYQLGKKLAREEGVQDILEQMVGRIARAFERISNVHGKRILDIASGSNTSLAPSSLYVNAPLGERRIGPEMKGYTALFEPWFCRILVEMSANPVGVDMGDLEGEVFEHYHVDLRQLGALNFFPARSFDAVQDSRLFGSPEFSVQFPNPNDRLRLAAEIWRQEQRVLKTGVLIIHSDARELLGR